MRLLAEGHCASRLLILADQAEAHTFADIYRALIGVRCEESSVQFAASTAAAELLRGRLDAEVMDVGPLEDVSHWARDVFLPALDDNGRLFRVLPSGTNARTWEIQRQLGGSLIDLGFQFAGGNVLVSEKAILVGEDTLAGIDDEQTAAVAKLTAALERIGDVGRRVIPVKCEGPVRGAATISAQVGGEEWRQSFFLNNAPDTRQPIFHIDVFVTLVGEAESGAPKVLVGDPRLAAEILGWPLHPLAQAPQMDSVAKGLADQGCEVGRVPLPMIYMDTPAERLRQWFYVSYNNVVQERGADGAWSVLMPLYGHDNWSELEAADMAARGIYEELGFEVRGIPGCQLLSESMGGLRCLTNTIGVGS